MLVNLSCHMIKLRNFSNLETLYKLRNSIERKERGSKETKRKRLLKHSKEAVSTCRCKSAGSIQKEAEARNWNCKREPHKNMKRILIVVVAQICKERSYGCTDLQGTAQICRGHSYGCTDLQGTLNPSIRYPSMKINPIRASLLGDGAEEGGPRIMGYCPPSQRVQHTNPHYYGEFLRVLGSFSRSCQGCQKSVRECSRVHTWRMGTPGTLAYAGHLCKSGQDCENE